MTKKTIPRAVCSNSWSGSVAESLQGGSRWTRRRRAWAVKVSGLLLILAFVFQASVAARRDSVTIDEFVHLPLGLYMLYSRDFTLDPINPPLSRMIAALPLLRRPPAFSTGQARAGHWALGYHFMQANRARYQDIFVSARFMVTLMAAALGLLLWVWATQLYGRAAGLVALFLFSLSPSMLAHGHLVTLDMAGALGFTATAYAAWRLLDRPGIVRALVLGLMLGLAVLLKLSAFVLLAAVLLLCLIRCFEDDGRGVVSRLLRWAGLLCVVAVMALFVLNLGYGFDGSLAPLTGTRLQRGGLLAGIAEALPWLRLPLPRPFVEGVDMVLNVGKGHEPSYFLAGELSADGWWYYHLAAFVLKSPLPLLIGCVAAFALWASRRSRGLRDYCLYVPVLIIFAANSAFNSLYIGVRHVLPVYPLLFVAVSPLFAKALNGPLRRERAIAVPGRHRGGTEIVAALTAVTLLLWYAAGSWAVAPRYLQYFNEAAGGPARGHLMLVDSNIDWGQDLIRLAEYMKAQRRESVALAYFGRVDPSVYGISFTPLQRGRSRGFTAVSASFLMGRPYFWIHNGRMGWVGAGTYTWMQQYEPIGRAGSMFLYDLPAGAGDGGRGG